ncbi:MAG: tetratricopeptide repeat protein [Asgard group archaeon]|nr:tetratricopeptide repeat protein [Asgard group archaeon]
MSKSTSTQLAEIELLIVQCSFKEALNLIDAFEKQKDIQKNDLLASQVLKSNIMNKIGLHQEAVKIADKIIEESSEADQILLKLDGLFQKSQAFWRTQNFRDHLITLEMCSQIVAKLEKLPENIVDKRKAVVQYLKMGVPYVTGEYDLSIVYGKQGLELAEKLEDKLLTVEIINGLAVNYRQQDEIKKAMNHFEKAIKLSEDINNVQEAAFALAGKALIHVRNRDFNKAIELRQKAIEMNEKAGANRDLPLIYHNLGQIYSQMHELDIALEYFLKYLEYMGENIVGAQVAFSNIGYIYYRKGDLNLALEYYLKAKKTCEAIGDQRRIFPRVLYNLICLSVDLEDQAAAQKYLEHFKLISDLADNELITRLYTFAEGLVNKASSRMGDWSKALEIYDEELKKEDLPSYWEVVAHVNISEILMRELHITGEQVIFDEVKKRIQKLISIAEKDKYYMLLAEAYWIQAQLDLAELNIENAKNNLKKASIITKNKGLVKLAKDILLEQEKLENQLNTWEGFAKEKKPLVEALKHLTLEEGMKKVTKETILEELDERTGKTIEYRTIFALKIT